MTFHGRQAHAASDPWMGKNALDALILLFTSVGLWRQQLRPDARVHGVVQEGGTAANIIPSRSKAWFMIRSPREDDYSAMRDRFRELCEAAAAAAGCTVDVVVRGWGLDDEAEPDPRRAVRREHGRLRRPGPPADRQPGQQRHGQREPGDPHDPPVDRDLRRRACRVIRSSSSRRPRRPAATRSRCSRRRSSPRRPTSCSPIRASSRPPGASSAARADAARLDAVAPGRSASERGGTIDRGAPRWTLDANRRRPQGRTIRVASTTLRRARPVSRRTSMSERHDPDPTADFAALNGWDREYEVYSATSTCRPMSDRPRS